MNKDYYKYTEEEISSISDISITDYIRKRGIELKKLSRNEYKIEGYGGLIISEAENNWYCFTADKGGGLIQLIQFLENKSWIEAVEDVLGEAKENIALYDKTRSEKEEIPLILPERSSSARNVIAYLCTTRKLDYDIVLSCLKNKSLYQDRKNNCVFVGFDTDGRVKHIHLKGTNIQRPFQKDVEGSDKSYCFSVTGTTNKVFVFESPIDLLSFMTIQKDMGNELKEHYISSCSTSSMRLNQYLEDYPNIKEVALCFDNDSAGLKATNRIKEELKETKLKISVLKPDLKDFNEMLVFMKSNENPLIKDAEMEL